MMSTNKASAVHFGSIDFLRSIAAVSVCIFHLATGYLHSGNPIYELFKEGHLGVEVFFVITGFLVSMSLARKHYSASVSSFGRYLLDRILRLQPAYLVAVFICVLQEYIGSLMPGLGRPFWVQWQDILWHFLYLPPIVDRPWLLILFWTLMIQFQFYILFALLYKLFMNEKKWIRILTLGFFITVNFFLDDLKYNNYLPYYMVIFIPGILLYQRSVGMWSAAEFWLLLMIDCCVLYDQRFEEILRPAAVLLAVFCISYLRSDHAIWKWLGSISFSLYLIHLPVGWSFMGFIKQYTQDEMLLSVGLLAAVSLSIAAAFLFYKTIEAPSQKLASKILARIAP